MYIYMYKNIHIHIYIHTNIYIYIYIWGYLRLARAEAAVKAVPFEPFRVERRLPHAGYLRSPKVIISSLAKSHEVV